MKKNSENQSFRRKKLIEEMAPQRKADALASSQNDELGNIAEHLKEAQAASEMAAEAIEQKGNQIITSLDGINKKLEDTNAGVELASEAIERVGRNTQATTGAARAISAKISKLTDMLAEKLTADIKKAPNTSESTTLAALEEVMPIQVEQPKLQELLEQLIPQNPIPEDAPFLPPPEQPDEDKKAGKTDKTEGLGLKFDDLLKSTKGGFKAVVSVTDRIAGMLFKYTVTALANAAKFAAQILAVIFGIDSIRVYFQYFMKQFESGWKEFNDKFKEWGPILEGLMTFAKNAEAMFSEKNWIGLAEAIINGMVKLTLNMANLLMLGINKMTAAILRTIPGMSETADNIEARALMTYQQNTGATLDDEDSTKIAKYQDRQDAEEFKAKNEAAGRFKDKDKGLTEAERYRTVSKETADEIRAGKVDSSFRDLPEEQRLEIFKKRNQAQADIIRLTETANNLMKPDDTDKKNAKASYDNIQKQLNDPALRAAPKDLNIEQLLDKLNKSLEKFNTDTVKPQPVEQREEVQQASRVGEGMKAKEAASSVKGAGDAAGNLFQQVNMTKTSKTQYNMPPQSSTPAPGMHGATRVN